ncbi:hypothetical protein D1007_08716 [Hordeum vulgare]|nr:hypothetical protein D1007_08716 [Hordeum vulgare]
MEFGLICFENPPPFPISPPMCSLVGDQTLASNHGRLLPRQGQVPCIPPRDLPAGLASVSAFRWHWEHRITLPYLNVTLPHYWHVDPERIPVSAMSWSARMHAEEVSRRWRQLTSEQRLNPVAALGGLARGRA